MKNFTSRSRLFAAAKGAVAAAIGLAALGGASAPSWSQSSVQLYWQCVPKSATQPNGGFCPANLTYPQPTQNQARQGVALTKSDSTVIAATKGIHVGDGTACDVAVLLAGDSVAVTLQNVQPGSDHPYSIVKLMSTNTTCTSITALY